MAAIDDDNASDMIMANILELCKNGCTKDKIIQETHLSYDQLRRITVEMLDKEFLHYIEHRLVYITTDKGYIFLSKRYQSNILKTSSKAVDKKIKTKEKLNSIASKQNIIHRKIQLWTNRYQNEFAIRLTADSEILTSDDSKTFLAATNPKEHYIIVVAETDYFEDLKLGWEYTLSHLIEQYKQKIHTISLRKNTSNNSANKIIEKENNNNNNNNNRSSIRLIQYIKCQYCNSEFNTEEEKKEHELEWHI
jgi:predicted transcriptional regulator